MVLPPSSEISQPGLPRFAHETLNEIETQVQMACLGVAQPIKDLQSNRGVKDAYTQSWIEEFINRSREFQRANPGITPGQIQGILMGWVSNNRNIVYNNYLLLEGKHRHHLSSQLPLLIWPLQTGTLRGTRLLNCCIRYCSESLSTCGI